jgi:hypothetical protein
MKVVFDTTVFGQGFNSQSADVRLFKDFIKRAPTELCVPGVVFDEAVNLVRKSIEDVNSKLNAARRLTGDEKTYARIDSDANTLVYRDTLDVLLRDLNARILNYPKVSHEQLVARALAGNKPFAASGRGYKDTLIWFSVIELLQSSTEELIFITANSEDFWQNKTDCQLHQHLVSDLTGLGISGPRIRLFPSLADFNQQYSIKELPVSEATETKAESPDYQQLLIDGQGLVITLLQDALPGLLKTISQNNVHVQDVAIASISGPSGIDPLPIRKIDDSRRLLQFAADYRVSVQFLINRSDFEMWAQRLSFHQRQEWDDTFLRVLATIPIKALFRMIERGEETEAFSLVSVATGTGVFEDYNSV